VVATDPGALPLRPTGGGAAGVPGPAGCPGRRTGDRARTRRVLAGTRRPGPGPGVGLRGPTRIRPPPRYRGFDGIALLGLPGPGADVPAGGSTGGPGPRVGAAAGLVDLGRRGRGATPVGRRRPGHREDASRGRPGARRRGGGPAGFLGSLRRGSGGAVPTLRGGAWALLPFTLGGPHFAHARLAAHRALPPGRASARVRARGRGGGW
jgi:hypothetical protein